MTGLAHPDIPGVTVGGNEDGVVLTVQPPDAPGVVVMFSPEGAVRLADLLGVLAGAGWTTAASGDLPPSSEAVPAPSAATSPESQAS